MRKRGFGRRTPAGLLPLLVAAVVVVALSFGAGSALAAGSFNCSDNVGSDAGLQTLLDGGGTVTVNGICLGNYFVNTSVTIRGGAPGATLNGNATGSVLTFNGGYTLTVKSLTVTNGSSTDGGGINDNGYCGATTNLQNAQVWGNTASDDGGGFYTQCGTLNDPGSTIRNNYAGDEGGGIYSNGCGGTINVTNSTVSNNTAALDGGGILVYCSEINLTGASISLNNAGDYGGGIAVYEGSLLFSTASTITQNSALSEDGGGIDANSSIVTLTNTEVGANTALWYGGGINYGDPFRFQGGLKPNTAPAARGPQVNPRALAHRSVGGAWQQQPPIVFGGLDLESSTVDHNTAWSGAGGGINNYACLSDSPVMLNGSSVSGNRAVRVDLDTDSGGGGIANYGTDCGLSTTASVTATNTTVGGNLARNSVGGGIFNVNYGAFTDTPGSALVSMAQVRGSGQTKMSLTTNQARWGGGIFNYGDGASVSARAGAQVVHNQASTTGGGVFNDCAATSLFGPGSVLMLNQPNNLVNNLGTCILSVD